jgi:hypothetical protein
LCARAAIERGPAGGEQGDWPGWRRRARSAPRQPRRRGRGGWNGADQESRRAHGPPTCWRATAHRPLPPRRRLPRNDRSRTPPSGRARWQDRSQQCPPRSQRPVAVRRQQRPPQPRPRHQELRAMGRPRPPSTATEQELRHRILP